MSKRKKCKVSLAWRWLVLIWIFASATPALALPGARGASLTGYTRIARAEGGYAFDPLPAFGPAMYDRLRHEGVDLIRLVVRPLPLMEGTPGAQARARAQVLAAVRQLAVARIATIVDLHPWPPDTPDEEARLVCTPAGAVVLERMLLALARPLARMNGTVALELLNEPKRCEVDGQVRWPGLQRHLVRRIRSVAPTLPLVVTPPLGQLDDLLAFDAEPYRADPNILFSFHFYDPYIFTTPDFFKSAPVPFPSPGNVRSGTAAFVRMDRTRMSVRQSGDLWRYLTRPNGEAVINARFAALDRWRRAAGLPARRILLGEFGLTRTSTTGSPEDRRSNARWLAAVTRAARRNGIRSLLWLWPVKPHILWDPQRRWLRRDTAHALGLDSQR